MKPLFTMRQALSDDNLLASMLPGASWDTWRSILIASRGEDLTEAELALFKARTGDREPPTEPVEELAVVAGRRSGKTASMSTLSIYLAALCDWSDCLSRGERGVLVYAAQSTRTARVAFRYARSAFENIPLLSRMVENFTAETISLKTGIDLEIRPASFRSLRGITAIGAVADELAFWHSDELSLNPDREILAALRPALATTNGPLIMVSSPYAKRGELFEAYRRYFGRDGDVLVAQGTSRDFNETLPQKVVDRALERDPDVARSEYLGQFRDDISALLTIEAIEAVTDFGVLERQPDRSHVYYAFVDMSGGSSDSAALGIAHREGAMSVLDCVREVRAPHDPAEAVAEFCEVLKRYSIASVVGDKYAGDWPAAAFRKMGVSYLAADRSKSDIYRDTVAPINSGTVRLLDNERLRGQLAGLERRTGRGTGKDVIDHGPGQRDDLCNAAAGALLSPGFADRQRNPAKRSRVDLSKGQTFLPGPPRDTLKKGEKIPRHAQRMGH